MKHQKWEYKTKLVEQGSTFSMNQMGAEGWECYFVCVGQGEFAYYFKRPIIEEEESPVDNSLA